jgi:hypothetical protein
MNPDPKIDCAAAPVVTLAGREWFIPPLAMRQSRSVVPTLMRILPVLEFGESPKIDAMRAFGEAQLDDLVNVVHGALTRAYPQLSRDEFLDLPIRLEELFAAIPVVAQQCGFFKAADAPGEEQGETAPATSPAPLPTSTG